MKTKPLIGKTRMAAFVAVCGLTIAAQATTTVYTTDTILTTAATVGANSDPGFQVRNGATLTMNAGGLLGQADQSTFYQTALQLGTTNGSESGNLIMNSGSITNYENGGNCAWGIVAYGSSIATINEGTISVVENGNPEINLNTLVFAAYGNSKFILNGGDFAGSGNGAGKITPFIASDNAMVEIYGGTWSLTEDSGAAGILGFNLSGSAQVVLHGIFNYGTGNITDSTGTITGTLANGDAFSMKFDKTAGGSITVVYDGTPPPQHLIAHGLFQHNMVLQRDMDVPVWGRAAAGAVVTLRLDGSVVGMAVTDTNGNWFARIGSRAHDGGASHTLGISSPGEVPISLTNVVFGDVYVASGQSNMARLLSAGNVIGGAAEIAAANYPLVRQVSVSQITNSVPLLDPVLTQGWTPCSPSTASGFSATGYFFAKNVHLQTGVPVGLLFSAWGGREIKRFLAPAGVAAVPELAGLHQYVAGGGDPEYYDIYHGMIAPLMPYGVRGVIWYQGEWDAGAGDFYHQQMRALLAGWRQNWGQGDFSFYFVQLPNYGTGLGYATIREAQLRSISETNCGMAVTIDTGDGNLHPLNKQDVGYRLAQWAVARDHGQSIPYSGPLLKGVLKEGARLRIDFDFVNSGLMTGYKYSTNPVVPMPAGPLQDFEVAGADKMFAAATAAIESNTVVVFNPGVTAPVYVRYCYTNWPAGSNHLYNLDGLPASPFRTDVDYPLTVQSGNGDNSALVPGALQPVSANAAPAGMVFDRWIGTASGLDNLNAANATVTMPGHALFLLASYRAIGSPAYLLTVHQGFGTGTSQADSWLNIEAQPPAPGLAFDRWTGDTQAVANVFATSTTLQMPASNVVVTATYRPLSAPASPRIDSIRMLGGTNLVLTGGGGPTNGSSTYRVRSTTTLTLPSIEWSVAATNAFNPDGSFSNSLPVTPGAAREFYRIQTP
jgi:hypothetical protein